QYGEKGVVMATGVRLLRLSERHEKVYLCGLFGAAQSDHHFIQATQKEVDFGPEQRLAALLRRRPQNQIGQEFAIALVSLWQASHLYPLRGRPRRFFQSFRFQENLGTLIDVFV